MGQGPSGPGPGRAALTPETQVSSFPLPVFCMKMFTRTVGPLGVLLVRIEAVMETRVLIQSGLGPSSWRDDLVGQLQGPHPGCYWDLSVGPGAEEDPWEGKP